MTRRPLLFQSASFRSGSNVYISLPLISRVKSPGRGPANSKAYVLSRREAVFQHTLRKPVGESLVDKALVSHRH